MAQGLGAEIALNVRYWRIADISAVWQLLLNGTALEQTQTDESSTLAICKSSIRSLRISAYAEYLFELPTSKKSAPQLFDYAQLCPKPVENPEDLTRINSDAWRFKYTKNMNDRYHFKVTAKLLREGAVRPNVSPEQASQAKKLAEYFENLAEQPSANIADKRFA